LEYVAFAGDQSVTTGHPVQERLFQKCLQDGDDERQGARSCPLQGTSLPQMPEHIGGDVVEHGQYGLLRIESVLSYDLGRQWSADRAGDVFTPKTAYLLPQAAHVRSRMGASSTMAGSGAGDTVLDPPQ
jgi:hypothetical protein